MMYKQKSTIYPAALLMKLNHLSSKETYNISQFVCYQFENTWSWWNVEKILYL